MDKKEILEKELGILEELKALEEDEGQVGTTRPLTLKDLSDPKSLGRLRRLVWPGY